MIPLASTACKLAYHLYLRLSYPIYYLRLLYAMQLEAAAVANTLLYGADHLSKGNVVLPPDDTSPDEDLDEDALAL
jgi:hypothetical protein